MVITNKDFWKEMHGKTGVNENYKSKLVRFIEERLKKGEEVTPDKVHQTLNTKVSQELQDKIYSGRITRYTRKNKQGRIIIPSDASWQSIIKSKIKDKNKHGMMSRQANDFRKNIAGDLFMGARKEINEDIVESLETARGIKEGIFVSFTIPELPKQFRDEFGRKITERNVDRFIEMAERY